MSTAAGAASPTGATSSSGRAKRSKESWDAGGARWLLIPPGVLMAAGLVAPFIAVLAVALRDNGPVGVISHPLSSPLIVHSLIKTLYLAVATTAVTWIAGVIFVLALGMSPKWLRTIMFGILFLTFWISLLVRTYGWVLTLQPNGALDMVGQKLGLTSSGFGLFQTMPGLLPPMVHIMLPYMVLPIYSSLRALDPAQVRASRSLGASETLTLRKVVLPSLAGGGWAAVLLVFILSLGFYVTPAFLGGPNTQVVAMVIGLQFGRLDNLGLTAALGALLLIIVLGLYVAADKVFKISRQWGEI